MKIKIIALLLLIASLGYGQSTGSYWKVQTTTERFARPLYANTLVRIVDTALWVTLTHDVTPTMTMRTVFDSAWYKLDAGGGGGDSYWTEAASNLANIDTTTGFYVNSTSGVKNVNLSMYPASSWWRIEQSNRTTGVQSVAQGSAGVVSLQANAGGATDVVQVNGAGYLYGRTGSNGLNLGSSTYRWGTAYLDTITTNKDININGVTVGRGRKSTFGSTAIGEGALAANISGGSSTAIGAYALYANTTGQYNVATGIQALYKNTTGKRNLAYGSSSAGDNTTGSHNTAIGDWALKLNVTGNYNIALGDSAGYTYTTLSNRMYLGARDSTTNGIFFNRNTKIGRWNGALIADGTITATGGTSTNWNTAYGWGNHASAGYLTDPTTDHGDMIVRGVSGVVRLATPDDNGSVLTVESSYPTWKAPAWTYVGSDISSLPAKRVSVGTGTPTRLFNVFGAARSDTAQTPLVLGGTAASSSLTLKSTSATGSSDFIAFKTGSGSERVRITSGGNVGIGTTNPIATLDVRSGASTYLQVSSTSVRSYSNFLVISSGSFAWADRGGVTISSPSNNTISINSANVGIGTTAPTAKLHVNGGIMLDGTDTTGVGSSAKVGTIQYYNGNFYGLKAGTPPTWVQLNN